MTNYFGSLTELSYQNGAMSYSSEFNKLTDISDKIIFEKKYIEKNLLVLEKIEWLG